MEHRKRKPFDNEEKKCAMGIVFPDSYLIS
jgi:hypothetical protein